MDFLNFLEREMIKLQFDLGEIDIDTKEKFLSAMEEPPEYGVDWRYEKGGFFYD